MSVIYGSLIALAAGSLGRWLGGHPGIGRRQGKVAGCLHLWLGARPAVQER